MKIDRLEKFLYEIYMAGQRRLDSGPAEAGWAGRKSVLVLGPPGVGKSLTAYSLGRRIAKTLGKTFIDYSDDVAERILSEPDKYFVFVDLRLTECEPSDLIGIPRTVDGATAYHPLLWAKCLSKCAGLLFLDEITNIQRPDVISASYKLLYDRKAGFTKFHPDVFVIAAGNTPEHSSVANLLPVPLIDRTIVVEIDPPRVRTWAKWMNKTYGEAWDRRVLAFLLRFEDEHYILKTPRVNETLENYPTPRSWTDVALLLHAGLNSDELFIGTLGKEVGQKFKAFLKVRVDLEELMSNPELFKLLDLDARYMTCVMLGNWLSKNIKKAKKAFPLIDAMAEVSRDLLVLTVMSMRRNLAKFFRMLFAYNKKYSLALNKVFLELRKEIANE